MRPPILLIHGASSHPGHLEPWVSYFTAAGHHCVAPPLPGHVPSDPGLLARLDLDDYVAALGEALARLDRPPVLIGHSMGGLLAQMLATRADCAGLVLVSSPAPGLAPPRFRLLANGIALAPAILAGRPFRPRQDAARVLVVHDLAEAEQDEVLADFGYESGRAFRSLIFGRTRVSAQDVRCPVLCLAGGADRVVSPSVARRLAQRYGGELVVFPGRGHWLLAGSLVDLVAARVLAWIESLETRKAAARAPPRPSFDAATDL